MATHAIRCLCSPIAVAAVVLGAATQYLSADQVIIDHQPHPVGGIAADTDYVDYFSGHWRSTSTADDFVLQETTTIGRLKWWGFYIVDNAPESETFRIRIHNSDNNHGLPGSTLFEYTSDDVARIATGRTLVPDLRVREFAYELHLPLPWELAGATKYWLEILSVGETDVSYYWEFSITDLNGYAFQDTYFPDWTASGSIGDAAFQLYAVPDPSTAILLGFGAGALTSCRRRAR